MTSQCLSTLTSKLLLERELIGRLKSVLDEVESGECNGGVDGNAQQSWTQPAKQCADATLGDLVQAEALLDDTYTRFRRVMGDGHPDTPQIHESLLGIRGRLARARASLHAHVDL